MGPPMSDHAAEEDRVGRRRSVASYTQELDPVLVAPVRLFIVTLLAEMRWCDFATICDALNMSSSTLSQQLKKLRAIGYIETQRPGRHTWVRLTPEGCERLTDHLEALQAVVVKAAGLIEAGAIASDDPPLAEEV